MLREEDLRLVRDRVAGRNRIVAIGRSGSHVEADVVIVVDGLELKGVFANPTVIEEAHWDRIAARVDRTFRGARRVSKSSAEIDRMAASLLAAVAVGVFA